MTYVNYGSVTAIGIIFPVLGLIALALRLYGRCHFDKNVGVDDILLVPVAGLNVACGVALIIAAQLHVIGGHNQGTSQQSFYSVADFEATLEKVEYAYWVGYILAIAFIKLALLFFFRRVFSLHGYRSSFDYVNWTLIAGTIAWALVCTFLNVFSCGLQFSQNWSSLDNLQHVCLSSFSMLIMTAVTDWALDVAIFLEPAIMISSLRLQFAKKLPSLLIFGTSLFAVTAGLLRMIVFIQSSIFNFKEPTISLIGQTYSAGDLQGVVSVLVFWTYLEVGVGFLVACLPPCGRVVEVLIVKPTLEKMRMTANLKSEGRISVQIGRRESDGSDTTESQKGRTETSIRQTSVNPETRPSLS